MKLRFLKQIVLMVGILSALIATAACPRRASNCRKPRRVPIVRNYRTKTCAKPSFKTSRKGGCGHKTTIIVQKKGKGGRPSAICTRPIVPGRYHIRFERQRFTNGFEQVEFRRPVRTRY